MNRRRFSILAASAWAVPALQAAEPALYARGTTKLVVPFPAGSSTDALGREVARFMAQSLEQTWITENKPGALATMGSAEVARARPDGYTLLLGTSTSHAAAPSLFRKLPYDPAKDFAPIGRVGAVVFALVVRADHPAKTIGDLVTLGRRRGDKPLAWGYANSANRVACAELARHGEMQTIAVPYKGVPQILVDILGGSIDFTIADVTSVLPQVRGGKMRALAVTSAEEIAALPGVPPMRATVPGFTLLGWYALFAPAGTPQPILALLSDHLQRGLKRPEVQANIEAMGLTSFPAGPAETASYVDSEIAKWAKLVKSAQIDPE